MPLKAWLRTYLNPEVGIDEGWIREHRGTSATAEGVTRWREFIEAANQQPDLLLCRVARSATEIAGVVCGRRGRVVTLGPMYVLNHVQGRGLGGRMMTEFLTWAGAAPICPWDTDDNDSAIRFHQRHGFTITGERELRQGSLPDVGMTREVVSAAGHR
ncbi:GNAT family N-acetyltransferase [Streptomyces sp. NPDC059828]|uniref:GNAT family N-acetyltransferase n=1 Tax=Streptomyces sp. NPDC059828 TaxID=3346965 RepID=UPI003655B630